VGRCCRRQPVADDRGHQRHLGIDVTDWVRSGGACAVRETWALERSGYARNRQRRNDGDGVSDPYESVGAALGTAARGQRPSRREAGDSEHLDQPRRDRHRPGSARPSGPPAQDRRRRRNLDQAAVRRRPGHRPVQPGRRPGPGDDSVRGVSAVRRRPARCLGTRAACPIYLLRRVDSQSRRGPAAYHAAGQTSRRRRSGADLQVCATR
jgi:hypothetical protein